MRNILTLLLLTIAFKSAGQNQLIDFSIGPSWTNAKSKDLKDNRDTKVGLSLAVGYSYHLNSIFSFSADLQYNQRGYIDTYFTTTDGTDLIENKIDLDYDYLSIPIKGGLRIGEKFNGFINLGVVPSILVKAKFEDPLTESEDVTDQVDKFDFAVLIESGVAYQFKKYYLFTSLTYQQSLTSLTNDNFFQNVDMRHIGLTFSLGLKYVIGQE